MMIEPRDPRYQWGQRVVSLSDMFNDGSYPDKLEDELLVAVGNEGDIVQVGVHEESQQPVYMVDFDGLVVGCMEEEIVLLQELQEMARQARAVPHEQLKEPAV
jgi:nitrogen fixation protein NifZ